MNEVIVSGTIATYPEKIKVADNKLKVIGKIEVSHAKGIYTFDYEIWDFPARKFTNEVAVGSKVLLKGELKETDVFDANNQYIGKKIGILAKKILFTH